MDHGRPILSTVTHLDARYGGPSTCVPLLTRACNQTGRYRDTLVAFCSADEAVSPAIASGADPVVLGRVPIRGAADIADALRLRQFVREAELVHIHSTWDSHSLAAALLALFYCRPYIVSTHGWLTKWALAYKRWRKVAYSLLVERPRLRRAACLRALTAWEAREYREFGLSAPIAIIPNGVETPPLVSCEPFLERYPHLRGRRLVTFLSRLHPKKGLDLLVQAWRRVSAKHPEAHLVIAGPDSEGTRRRVEAMLDSLGTRRHATLVGMLYDELKWSALAASTVFILPSYSEGFSVAVLEALAVGCPVIITDMCGFPQVAEAGCGRIVRPSSPEIEAALLELLSMSGSKLAGMGVLGSELVTRCYSWPVIGQKMADVYDWMLGGSLPATVDIWNRQGT